MKISPKLYSVTVLLFSIVTIVLAGLFFLGFVNIDYVMLGMGVTQLFSGINQINLSQQINSKGSKKGNKMVGLLTVFLGVVIIIVFIYKRYFLFFNRA